MANDELPSDESLPEGNDIQANKNVRVADPLLPSAEAYENQASDLDTLIEQIKLEVTQELKDELTKLQYLLTQKEQELKLREMQLAVQAKQLAELQERLSRIESNQILPPSTSVEAGIEEFGVLSPEEQELVRDHRGGNNNPSGIGGKPGSARSTAIIINRDRYQGPFIPLEDGSELTWDENKKEYTINSAANKGLEFTFFAVEAAYINEDKGFVNNSYPHMYSQTIFKKQVWYGIPIAGKERDSLELLFGGRVPFEELVKALNSRVNSALYLKDGGLIENQDFRVAYKNWRFKYEVGTYYKTRDGELYTILSEVKEDSKGNPPTLRSPDKHGKPRTVSNREKAQWKL